MYPQELELCKTYSEKYLGLAVEKASDCMAVLCHPYLDMNSDAETRKLKEMRASLGVEKDVIT